MIPAIPKPKIIVMEIMLPNPINFPNTISKREVGWESNALIEPRSISPIIAAYPSMSAIIGTRN